MSATSHEATRVLEILEEMAGDAMSRVEATDPLQRSLDYAGLHARMGASLKHLCRALGADDLARRLERHDREDTDRVLGHGWRERARERRKAAEAVAESLDRETVEVVPHG